MDAPIQRGINVQDFLVDFGVYRRRSPADIRRLHTRAVEKTNSWNTCCRIPNCLNRGVHPKPVSAKCGQVCRRLQCSPSDRSGMIRKNLRLRHNRIWTLERVSINVGIGRQGGLETSPVVVWMLTGNYGALRIFLLRRIKWRTSVGNQHREESVPQMRLHLARSH